MKKSLFPLLFLGATVLPGLAAQGAEPPAKLALCCKTGNDLYRVLKANGIAVTLAGTPAEALERAVTGGGIMILADGYPQSRTATPPDLLEKAARKNCRVYLEYPAELPGVELGKPRAGKFERAVVASDFFGTALPKLRILQIQSLQFLPVTATAGKTHLVASRVAGVDTAVYGLTEEALPLLFEHPDGRALIASTALSRFVTARYAPAEAWREIWAGVLHWLVPDATFPMLAWTPTVRPTFSAADNLPADVETAAIRRSVQWYRNSQLILSPERLAGIEEMVKKGDYLATVPPPTTPCGDGKLGIMEAIVSNIQVDGSQPQGTSRRGDCQGESALALALGGRALGDNVFPEIARNILKFWYFDAGARDKEWGDPKHGAYGLIAWSINSPGNYGDDNARLMLGTAAAATLLGDDRFDEPMMMCLLANLRTTGQLGFRGDCFYLKQLGREGWEKYFKRPNFTNYSPHMEAYLWSCFLWAYQQTKYPLFLERARTAIGMTMQQHTDGWRWTNGLAQERARMILPLAWLVRTEDTPEHRKWLRTCAEGLVNLQQPSGAIREELGLPGKGMFAPPKYNRHYGSGEAPLIQQDGDTISDLLYTTNFAFLGLHEAAAATGDDFYRKAEDKLAAFLCRAQVRSETQPALDGGWFRGFDFKRWEYWASSSDAGWGVWCTETGWTQGWITSVLAMRQSKTSLWELTAKRNLGKYFDKYRREMLPDRDLSDK